MARGSVDKNYFQFTKGRITEASALTYPENSLLDEKNVEIDFNGTLRRRKGIKMEGSASDVYAYNPNYYTNFGTYVWNNPSNTKNVSVLVVYDDTKLVFFDLNSDPVVNGFLEQISVTRTVNSSSDLSDYIEPDMQVIEAKGKLIVVGKTIEPMYITYDDDAPSGYQFDYEFIKFFMRDLEGLVPKGFSRTTSFPLWKKYCLYNQGWPVSKKVPSSTKDGATLGSDVYAVNYFKSILGVYPSSADAYSRYSTGFSIDRDLIKESSEESTDQAPRGRSIIDPFQQFRIEPASGTSFGGTFVGNSVSEGEPVGYWYETPTTFERPSCVEFYQGHVCYAGVSELGFSDVVFVSQTLTDISVAGKCHSVNDPTNDVESSPLDTDGGLIRITSANNIKALKSIAGNLIVFADNGVWAITPSPDSIFSVNNFSVNKISNQGLLAAKSVVEYQGSLFYWGQDGIYTLTVQGIEGIRATNITETTIQEDYNALNVMQKRYCTGTVDPEGKKIYWMYDKDITESSQFRYKYNKFLVLDLRIGGFYTFEVYNTGISDPFVCSAFVKPNFQYSEITSDVEVNGVQVQVNGDDVQITSRQLSAGDGDSGLTFLCFEQLVTNPINMFTATFSNRSFLDWETIDSPGHNYDSYFETGHELVGDAMRKKKIEHIFFYFNRTEENFVDNGSGGVEFDYPSSCKVRVKWDWTTSGSANRWSKEQQAYRFRRNYVSGAIGDPFDYDFDVIVSKLRARGNGKSLRVRCESEEGKDFQLLGWAATYTAGALA